MKKAIFTSVYNEKTLLRLWLKYYSPFFDHILVIDHMSDDGSIEELSQDYKFQVIHDDRAIPTREDKRSIDPEIDLGHIKEYQKELFNSYEWVVYSHADEFIVPDPEGYLNLDEYIERLTSDYAYCTGYHVVQDEENEPGIDWDAPIIKQRNWWVKDFGYNKPLISRVPLNWVPGCHRLADIHDTDLHTVNDPRLFLFHLQQVDEGLFNKRTPHRSWHYEWQTREGIPYRLKTVF